jgi:diacylglycerol kinase (ATP)
MKSMAVIVNPIAGAARTRLRPDAAATLVRDAGFDPEIILTRLPGGASELAAQAATRHPLVAVVGGDGTVSEAARGLAGSGVPMVILPCGSGNDFAYGLGLHTPAQGLAAAAGGQVLHLDTAWFADRMFINTCGLFFDGEVSLRAADVSRIWGKFRYTLATLGLLNSYRAQTCQWDFGDPAAGGATVAGRWLLAEIGNGRRCGGGFLLTPKADPADGLLDFCLVREMSRMRFLRTLPRGINGSHLGVEGVLYRQQNGAKLVIPEDFAVHWDGEAERLPAGTYEFRLDRGQLQVMIPDGVKT